MKTSKKFRISGITLNVISLLLMVLILSSHPNLRIMVPGLLCMLVTTISGLICALIYRSMLEEEVT